MYAIVNKRKLGLSVVLIFRLSLLILIIRYSISGKLQRRYISFGLQKLRMHRNGEKRK